MNIGDAEIIKGIGGKTGEAKWKEIEDLVKRWGRRNPAAMKLTVEYAAALREEIKDKKYGFIDGPKNTKGVGGGGTRVGMVIHPELLNVIQAFYPKFMDTNEDVAEFKKRFAAFKIPERG